jgi:hypothetical protein
MSESYDAKLKRRLKTRSKFPPALQQVPIRYVDPIAALDAAQIDLLAQACCSRLLSFDVALSRFKGAGQTVTIEYLLKNNQLEEAIETQSPPELPGASNHKVQEIEALTDILKECFPGMAVQSAKALVESPVMLEVLSVATSLRAAMESKNSQSDFVVVVLYAVIKYMKSTIEDRIRSTPAFLQTVQHSGLVWEGGE